MRLYGYTRLDNGELAVIDAKVYVAYHTISGEGGCMADGNVPRRGWLLRMKVSSDFDSQRKVLSDVAVGECPGDRRAEDGSGHLHFMGSAWSHPFVEAWVPLH